MEGEALDLGWEVVDCFDTAFEMEGEALDLGWEVVDCFDTAFEIEEADDGVEVISTEACKDGVELNSEFELTEFDVKVVVTADGVVSTKLVEVVSTGVIGGRRLLLSKVDKLIEETGYCGV